MEKKRERRDNLFDRYKLFVTPVTDDEGKLIGASFPYENNAVIKCKDSLSNVKQHLATSYFAMLTPEDKERWRPRKKRKLEVDASQPSVGSSGVTRLSRKDCAEILAKGCAIGSLPLSLAQNRGIRYICRKMNPTSVMVARSTVTRHVDNLVGAMRESVSTDLKHVRASRYGPVNISMCLDMWTSLSGNGHISVNVFAVDEQFAFHRFALGCCPFRHPHSAVRIAEEAAGVLERSGVSAADLIACTTDNEASALSGARKLAGTEEEKAVSTILPLRSIAVSLACSCHSLDLCGAEASRTPAFAEAFSHVTEAVTYFSFPKRREALEDKQDKLKTKRVRFIKQAPTRWNYDSDVCVRADAMSAAIDQLTEADLDLKDAKDKEEWLRLKRNFVTAVASIKPLLPLLQHANRTIQKLSSASRITISRVFPYALELYNEADALMKSDSLVTRQFSSKFRDQINERFYLKATPRLFHCAEYLDPNTCKKRVLSDGPEYRRTMRDDLEATFFRRAAGERKEDMFGESEVSSESGDSVEFKREFGAYLTEVRDSANVEDSLQWWKEHREKYPHIAFVARCVLAAQASSAEAERLFSVAAHVVNKWRTRLTGSRAENLILLSQHIKSADGDGSEDEIGSDLD